MKLLDGKCFTIYIYIKGKTKNFQPRKKTSKVKKYSKNLLRKTPEITDKPIQKTIHGQLDIKLRQFMEEELEILLEVWKTRKF